MVNTQTTVKVSIPLDEIKQKFKITGEVIKFAVPTRMKFAEADKADGKKLFAPLVIEFIPEPRKQREAQNV